MTDKLIFLQNDVHKVGIVRPDNARLDNARLDIDKEDNLAVWMEGLPVSWSADLMVPQRYSVWAV
jgi:hypothetical protein